MSTPEALNLGPCEQWITAADVAAVCTVEGTGEEAYDTAAQVASEVLWELSGRQFSGVCERTVRPCTPTGCPPLAPCGCCRLSEVSLAGYPVRQVTEVKIDGAVIDTTEYRLDRHRYLIRLADADGDRQQWPGCQRLDLDDTEEDTFSVTYEYGIDPPAAGLLAAAEFACAISGYTLAGECQLPAGTTRVTRQGITLEIDGKPVVVPYGPLTSLFLGTYNPQGLRRRPAIYSPDGPRFARQVGP